MLAESEEAWLRVLGDPQGAGMCLLVVLVGGRDGPVGLVIHGEVDPSSAPAGILAAQVGPTGGLIAELAVPNVITQTPGQGCCEGGEEEMQGPRNNDVVEEVGIECYHHDTVADTWKDSWVALLGWVSPKVGATFEQGAYSTPCCDSALTIVLSQSQLHVE